MSDDTSVLPYPPLPPSAYLGSKYATPDEKQLAKRIIGRFLDEARIGNVYEARAGFCGAHGFRFVIVSHMCGLGIKGVDSLLRPVRLNRTNAIRFIKNGAILVKQDV